MLQKTFIIALITLIFVLATGGMLWLLVHKITVEGAALRARVEAIADNNAKEKVYKDIERLGVESADHRAALSAYVLSEDQTSVFLTDIENIGKSQGIELVTNSLNVVTNAESIFDELTIGFTVTGREAGVKKMLKIFETLPYHSSVTSLSFLREKDGDVSSTVNLSVTLLKEI